MSWRMWTQIQNKTLYGWFFIIYYFISTQALIADDINLQKIAIQNNPYSKEHLQKPAPKSVQNFNNQLYNNIVVFIRKIGEQPNSSFNQFSAPKTLPNLYGFQYIIDDNNQLDSKKYSADIANQIQNNSKKVVETAISNKIQFLKFLQNGVNFKLDFTKIILPSKSNVSRVSENNTKKQDKIKYAVVVTDIVEHNVMPKYAALYQNDIEAHVYNQNYADIKWQISAIEEDPNTNVFNFIQSESIYSIEDNVHNANIQNPSSLLVPKLSFNTNIKLSKTELQKNLTTYPSFLISIKQEQDLYLAQLEMNHTFKLLNITHTFKFPIYKQFHILQTYDHKFKLTKISLINPLSYQNFYSTLHYLYQEQQYIYEISYIKTLYSIKLKAQTQSKINSQNQETYSIEFSTKI